jgi:hypothetical protein
MYSNPSSKTRAMIGPKIEKISSIVSEDSSNAEMIKNEKNFVKLKI